jgi:hypothetical protein
MRARIAIASAIMIVAALTSTVWWRASTPQRGSTERLAQAAQVVFARMPMKSCGDIEDGMRTLERATIDNAELCTPQQATELCAVVAEFIEYYYRADSPEKYIKWREAQGDVVANRDRMTSDPQYASAFDWYRQTGLISDQMTTQEIFGAIWRGRRQGTVSALCEESDGLLRTFKVLTKDDLKPPPFEGKLGGNIWVGGCSSMGTNWWPNDDFDRLLERDGRVLGGYLGAVVEFDNGRRGPMIWCCYWHPNQARWRLRAVLLNNLPEHPVMPPQI